MDDRRCQGNLDLSTCGILTRIAVTCANILTSARSSMGHPFAFIAEQKTLLPLTDFIEDPSTKNNDWEYWSEGVAVNHNDLTLK